MKKIRIESPKGWKSAPRPEPKRLPHRVDAEGLCVVCHQILEHEEFDAACPARLSAGGAA